VSGEQFFNMSKLDFVRLVPGSDEVAGVSGRTRRISSDSDEHEFGASTTAANAELGDATKTVRPVSASGR
jgi:hypothetical protein